MPKFEVEGDPAKEVDIFRDLDKPRRKQWVIRRNNSTQWISLPSHPSFVDNSPYLTMGDAVKAIEVYMTITLRRISR